MATGRVDRVEVLRRAYEVARQEEFAASAAAGQVRMRLYQVLAERFHVAGHALACETCLEVVPMPYTGHEVTYENGWASLSCKRRY